MASARSPWKPMISQGTSPRPLAPSTSIRPPSRMAATGPATSTRSPRIATTRPKVSSTSIRSRAAWAAARLVTDLAGSCVIGVALNASFTGLLNTAVIGLVAARSGLRRQPDFTKSWGCVRRDTAGTGSFRGRHIRPNAWASRSRMERNHGPGRRGGTLFLPSSSRAGERDACGWESGFVND